MRLTANPLPQAIAGREGWSAPAVLPCAPRLSSPSRDHLVTIDRRVAFGGGGRLAAVR